MKTTIWMNLHNHHHKGSHNSNKPKEEDMEELDLMCRLAREVLMLVDKAMDTPLT